MEITAEQTQVGHSEILRLSSGQEVTVTFSGANDHPLQNAKNILIHAMVKKLTNKRKI